MRALKAIVALLLIACALALVVTSLNSQGDLPGLLARMDPQGLAQQDGKMATAFGRVTTGLEENDRTKTLRALERLTDSYGNVLDLDGQNGPRKLPAPVLVWSGGPDEDPLPPNDKDNLVSW